MRHHHRHHVHHSRRLVERWLLDPGWPLREVGAFAHHLLSAVEGIVPLLAGVALTAAAALALTRAIQSRRLPHEAQPVRIGVPPE